ncbi:MAG TPA: HdeD family acid-resistance protein [Phycisphaerae bacterium]|jgi:uncharacterized membrane protein HdeD (DUF308 family)|nr:HdeD family acid-resistance protein [Phycisphaerae bacterium]HOB74811.1 HdeD family acid-resistance protein [Phycisphaerae bacterium]HOJ54354.1 HdeD family acid-resistance protein [Phycisphaerae bacterium]HOL26825.1 HdeD family acid-resistance protein [Phycisphaerae bacterium]HPP19986.1 HdeD family acid-resistance protein [Phycisphaerae bacterium]
MAEIPIRPHAEPFLSSDLRRDWLWLVILGAVLAILGLLALGVPLVATLVTSVFLGWLLIIGGILEVVHGLWHRSWRGFFMDLLIGVVYVVIGFMIVANPGIAMLTLTLLIAMFLIISGIFRIVTAVSERFPHWGWILFNGIVSLVLGIMIWRQWPASALWVIGLFVGIDMLLQGVSLIMLGLAAKKLPVQSMP